MVATLLTAVVFYFLVPLVGAWHARRTWSRFRTLARNALEFPEVDFANLQPQPEGPNRAFRLTGTLEAFEGKNRLWIGNDRVSAAVSLHRVPVYFLDDQSEMTGMGEQPPRRAEAATLGALPEGTQFLVAGSLVADAQGQVFFGPVPGRDLLVIAFEGKPSSVLVRALSTGRPLVDHWNAWTPVSLGVGVVVLVVLAYISWWNQGDRHTGLVALALAMLPATFFLPPGIVLFYWFTRLWARARTLRARASSATAWAAGTLQARVEGKATVLETVAHVALVVGMVANAGLLIAVLGLWLSWLD